MYSISVNDTRFTSDDSRAERFQKALGVNGRHASGAGGGNGLTVRRVLDIAGGEDTRHAGGCSYVRSNVPLLVHRELAGKEAGIGAMANRDEDAGARQFEHFACDGVLEADACDDVRAQDVFDH